MTEPFPQNDIRSALALLADDVPEPVVTDLVAAERAWAAGHRPPWPHRVVRALRGHPVVAWPVLVVAVTAVVAVVLVLVSAVASLRMSAPAPAEPTTGPGALPRVVYVAPPWTPSVTEAPIARAAYLVEVQARNGLALRGMVVSADDGTYRQVPVAAVQGTLSWDGRRLAWSEETGRASLAVLHVLDLPTGRVRRLPLPGDSAVSTTVEGLAFDHDGGRLAVWGSSSSTADGSGKGMLAVVDVGPAGTWSPMRVASSCYSTCFGPVAWLEDGRLAYPAAGPTVAGLGSVPAVAVPEDPRNSSWGTNLTSGPGLAVDGKGVTRYVVMTQGSGGEAPGGQPYRLVAATSVGIERQTPLGSPMDAAVLHAASDGALVELVAPAPAGRFGDGRATVERVTAAGRRLVSTIEVRVVVNQVAGEVADGGATAEAHRPRFGPVTFAWWSWHAPVLLGAVAVLGVLGLVVLLLVRFVPWRRLRRFRLTRRSLSPRR